MGCILPRVNSYYRCLPSLRRVACTVGSTYNRWRFYGARSDRDGSTGIRFQPHLCFSSSLRIGPAAGAVGMWKSGTLFAGFPSPVERVGNSPFEFSRLSRGRHFHRAFPLVLLGAKRRRSQFLAAALFAHRFTPHLEAVGVVDQPVENAISQSRITDLLVPLGHGQLAGQNHRSHLIAILTDF